MTTGLSCAALGLVLLGCRASDVRRQPDTDSLAADHLAGEWDASFHLGSEFRAGASSSREVRGTLTLVRKRATTAAISGMAGPVNYGLYDIDFTSFGFDPREDGSVPGVVARLSPASRGTVDSLFIDLEPQARGVSVLIRGVVGGDHAEGAWMTESPSRAGIGEWGRFTMTRRAHTRM